MSFEIPNKKESEFNGISEAMLLTEDALLSLLSSRNPADWGLPEDSSDEDIKGFVKDKIRVFLDLPEDATEKDVAYEASQRKAELLKLPLSASMEEISKVITERSREAQEEDSGYIIGDEAGMRKSDREREFIIWYLRNLSRGVKGYKQTYFDELMDIFNKEEICRRYELPSTSGWKEITTAIAEDIFFSNGSKIRDNWSDESFMTEIISAIERHAPNKSL